MIFCTCIGMKRNVKSSKDLGNNYVPFVADTGATISFVPYAPVSSTFHRPEYMFALLI
ncbi:hypothetical protein [Stieleria marina]